MGLKQEDRAMQKADAALNEECRRQFLLTYGAAAIALKNKWRFGQPKILKVFDSTEEIWHEVGEDNNVSMLAQLENETGIEMTLTNSSTSWHDLNYLNGAMPKFDRMTKAQYIFMRNKQRTWMGAVVQACLYLALYRNFEFGTTKLEHLMGEIGEIREGLGQKEKRIIEACRLATGINILDRFTKKGWAE